MYVHVGKRRREDCERGEFKMEEAMVEDGEEVGDKEEEREEGKKKSSPPP